MLGLDGVDRERGDAVVTARAAADDGGVQLRPLREAVPRAGVQHDETLAGGGEVEERLAVLGRVEELPVDADDRDVSVADLGRGLIAIFGVVDAEPGGGERGAVGVAEELAEVVRAAAADDEDLRLAGRPHDRLGLGQRSIAASAFFRTSRSRAAPGSRRQGPRDRGPGELGRRAGSLLGRDRHRDRDDVVVVAFEDDLRERCALA